jgi:hypothetical protein
MRSWGSTVETLGAAEYAAKVELLVQCTLALDVPCAPTSLPLSICGAPPKGAPSVLKHTHHPLHRTTGKSKQQTVVSSVLCNYSLGEVQKQQAPAPGSPSRRHSEQEPLWVGATRSSGIFECRMGL